MVYRTCQRLPIQECRINPRLGSGARARQEISMLVFVEKSFKGRGSQITRHPDRPPPRPPCDLCMPGTVVRLRLILQFRLFHIGLPRILRTTEMKKCLVLGAVKMILLTLVGRQISFLLVNRIPLILALTLRKNKAQTCTKITKGSKAHQ